MSKSQWLLIVRFMAAMLVTRQRNTEKFYRDDALLQDISDEWKRLRSATE
jgi:hypothetical protein